MPAWLPPMPLPPKQQHRAAAFRSSPAVAADPLLMKLRLRLQWTAPQSSLRRDSASFPEEVHRRRMQELPSLQREAPLLQPPKIRSGPVEAAAPCSPSSMPPRRQRMLRRRHPPTHRPLPEAGSRRPRPPAFPHLLPDPMQGVTSHRGRDCPICSRRSMLLRRQRAPALFSAVPLPALPLPEARSRSAIGPSGWGPRRVLVEVLAAA